MEGVFAGIRSTLGGDRDGVGAGAEDGGDAEVVAAPRVPVGVGIVEERVGGVVECAPGVGGAGRVDLDRSRHVEGEGEDIGVARLEPAGFGGGIVGDGQAGGGAAVVAVAVESDGVVGRDRGGVRVTGGVGGDAAGDRCRDGAFVGRGGDRDGVSGAASGDGGCSRGAAVGDDICRIEVVDRWL